MGKKPLNEVEKELRSRLVPTTVDASANITPAELIKLAKRAKVRLSDQDAFALLNHYSVSTIANRYTLDRPSFQPTFSWYAFKKNFWGPSQAEAMVQDWVPKPVLADKPRSLNQAHDAIKAVLARHAKQGSNGLRKLLRLLLGAGGGATEQYGVGISAPVFRREMSALGGDLSETECELLFEHNADPLTQMLNFDRFAAGFMPSGWAKSQYALADARKSMREEVEAKFGKAERPKREHPAVKAQPWKLLEKELHHKLVLRTRTTPKRQGVTVCYRLFSEEQNDKVDLQAFTKALNKLQMVFTSDVARELFDKYDKDGDGVISFLEFQRNLMPKDITDEAPSNTLFGDHAVRYEAPRKPRGANLERRIAMQQQGIVLPEVKQDLTGVTFHSLPARRSPFSLIAPEDPFKDVTMSTKGPSYATIGCPGPLPGDADIGRKDLQGRNPRRRKMDMPPPPTPHFFKSFHM